MDHTSQSSEQSTIKALRCYSTCDVSDALQSLGLAHGGFIAGPVMQSPRQQQEDVQVVGHAYTVQYKPVSAVLGTSTNKSGHYIDNVPSGAVVVIDAPADITNAVYGGMMSRRAKARGAAGTVVCGRVRDLNEHMNLGYPVFARGTGTASPYGAVKVDRVDEDIEVGSGAQSVQVRPGDYIIGDLNGVVCLPRDMVKEALKVMPSIVDQDTKVATDLANDVGFVEASNRHRVKR